MVTKCVGIPNELPWASRNLNLKNLNFTIKLSAWSLCIHRYKVYLEECIKLFSLHFFSRMFILLRV